MATASALEGLAPMQRRDSMARKMTKMFKSPDAHASYLTSSRFALDLIKVHLDSMGPCERIPEMSTGWHHLYLQFVCD